MRASSRYSSTILQQGGCSPVKMAGLYRFPSVGKSCKTKIKRGMYVACVNAHSSVPTSMESMDKEVRQCVSTTLVGM